MSNERNAAVEHLLPEEVLWADEGHASDVVLTCLADGQTEIVPLAVRAHVDACLLCSQHLGNAALLSLHTDRRVAEMAAYERKASARSLPKVSIALGLLVAVLGFMPSMVGGKVQLGALTAFALHDLPLYARGLDMLLRRLLAPGSATGIAITYGAAFMLVLMALVVVRLLPKKETSR